MSGEWYPAAVSPVFNSLATTLYTQRTLYNELNQSSNKQTNFMTQDIASCSAGEEIQLFMELEVCDIH